VMALLGGVLTIAIAAWRMALRKQGKAAIPYGIAIASAGLLTLVDKSLPMLAATTAG